MKKTRRNAKRLGRFLLAEGGIMFIALFAFCGHAEYGPFPSWTWIVVAITAFVLGQLFLLPFFIRRKMEKIRSSYIRAYRRGDQKRMYLLEREAQKVDVFVEELEHYVYPAY